MKRTNRKWAPEEDETLRRLCPDMTSREIAKILNRSNLSIKNRTIILGLRKPEQYPNAGCFKKGHVAFNKGRKRSEWMSAEGMERCSRTMFTKGHKSSNHRPVGFERLTKDGYIEVKTEEGLRRFRLKHRLIWEQHHGKIPKGMIVVFKDGDKTNLNIDNLELISLEENMKRNSMYSNYPKEMQLLFKLKGVLNRQINKHTSKTRQDDHTRNRETHSGKD